MYNILFVVQELLNNTKRSLIINFVISTTLAVIFGTAMTSTNNSAWAADITCTRGPVIPNQCTGTQDPDNMKGTSEADEMSGLNGNDNMNGFAGNDQMDGDLVMTDERWFRT